MKWIFDHKTGTMVELVVTVTSPGPYIVGDLPGYISPLGTGMIEGRTARREDMARGGVREVDPSERPQLPVKTREQAQLEKAQLEARPTVEIPNHVKERLMRR